MAKPNLQLVLPTTENRTVTPRRAPNTQLRIAVDCPTYRADSPAAAAESA